MTSHNQNQIFVYQSLGIGYGWMLNQYILPQSKCKCVLFRQNSLNSPVQGNGNHLRGRGARWTWVLIIHIHIVPDIAKNWTANHHFEELHGMIECWEMLRAPMGMSQLKKQKHPKIARLLDSAAKVFPKRYSTDLTFLLLVKTRHHLANSPICDGFYNVIPKWQNNIHIHIFIVIIKHHAYIHTYMYVTYHHLYMYIWSIWIPWLNWSIQINILIQLQFYHDWWLLGYIACIINIAYT